MKKLIKILAASISVMALLAAPTQAAINITPAQLSGSVVKIQTSMIHTQATTAPSTQGSNVVNTAMQGSSVVSLRGLIHPQTVAIPAASPNPDEIGAYNAPANETIVRPQVPAATALKDSEQQMFEEINQERADAGVAPVKIDFRLVTAARIKVEDLYLNHYFSHVSPNFGYTGSRLPGLGLNVGYWSENVAGNNSVDGAMARFHEFNRT